MQEYHPFGRFNVVNWFGHFKESSIVSFGITRVLCMSIPTIVIILQVFVVLK